MTVAGDFLVGQNVPEWDQQPPRPAGPGATAVIERGDYIIREAGQIYRDAGQEPYEDAGTRAGLVSLLACPVIVRGRAIGTLSMRSTKRHAYGPKDAELAMRIVHAIGGTVANAYLHAQLRQEISQLWEIEELSRLAAIAPNTSALVETSYRALKDRLGFDSLVGVQLDVGRGSVAAVLAAPEDERLFRIGPDLVAADLSMWSRLTRAASFEVQDADHGLPGVSFRNAGFRSWAVVPVKDENLLGFLVLCRRTSSPFTNRDLELAEHVSVPFAHGLSRLVRVEREQAERRYRHFLGQLERAARNHEPWSSIRSLLIEELPGFIHFDCLKVTCGAPTTQRLRLLAHFCRPEGSLRSQTTRNNDQALPEYKEDDSWENGKRYFDALPVEAGILQGSGRFRSEIIVPISFVGSVAGAIHVRSTAIRAYETRDVERTSGVAARIAIAPSVQQILNDPNVDDGITGEAALQGRDSLPAPELRETPPQGPGGVREVFTRALATDRTPPLRVPGRIHAVVIDRFEQCVESHATTLEKMNLAVVARVTNLAIAEPVLRHTQPAVVVYEHHPGDPPVADFLPRIAGAAGSSGLVVMGVSGEQDCLGELPVRYRSADRSQQSLQSAVAQIVVFRDQTGLPVAAGHSQAGRCTCASDQCGSGMQPLTRRELEILRLLTRGKTNNDIAEVLHLAPGTIRNRTLGIYRKLGAANRAEAIYAAIKLSVVQ